jgi:DNA mismatch repair protein MutS2
MEFDPVSLAPEYRLLVGVPGASHAIEVAERLGLAQELLDRAQQLVSRGDQTEQVLADVGRVRREAELMRVEAGEVERELAQRERDLAATEGEVLARARLREQEAEMAFREHYAAVRLWVEEARSQLLPQLPAGAKPGLEAILDRLKQLLEEEPLGRRWQAFVRGLRKGARVRVPKLNATVVVQKLDRKRERIRVRYENMDLELPFHDLSWSETPELD